MYGCISTNLLYSDIYIKPNIFKSLTLYRPTYIIVTNKIYLKT